MKPMLAEPITVVPEGPAWQMEVKLDGWRAVAEVGDDVAWLTGRNGADYWQTPYIEEALVDLAPVGTILDGELVSEHGRGFVQTTYRNERNHTPKNRKNAISYVAFDVLRVGNKDVTRLTLAERRKLLDALFKGKGGKSSYVQKGKAMKSTPANLDKVLEQGEEGVVVKRLSSTYRQGKRNGGWYKIKPQSTIEVRLTGFYEPTAGSKYDGNAVGGIEYETAWGYEGRAAGMGDALRRQMYDDPDQFIGAVVEVAHHGVTKDGALLHPQFKFIRDDKSELTSAEEAGVRKGNTMASSKTARKTVASPTNEGKRRTRNYGAMKDEKLLRAYRELKAKSGEAYEKSRDVGSGDPAADLRLVESLGEDRGLAVRA